MKFTKSIFLLLAIVLMAGAVKAATIRGVVTCDGQGVANVVVSDGISVTRTNNKGAYKLKTDNEYSHFVFISTPSGYEVPSVRGFMPNFYHPLEKGKKQYDFTLKAVDQTNYHLIVSADIHVRNRAMTKVEPIKRLPLNNPVGEIDAETFLRTYMVTLKDYVSQLPKGVAVYGLNLGDVSNESHWKRYGGTLENFVQVCERGGMPIQTYNVMGNHEHDMKARDIFDDDDTEAELEYMKVFGPTYYSFNIGGVHYVVLDNVKYCNHKSKGRDRNYEVRITQDQIDWAMLDAKYMPKDTKRVVIAWHCPAHRFYKKGVSNENTKSLLDIYAPFDVPMTILSGHNHQAESVTVAGYKNTMEYLHPSVSGSWWYFPVCSDGAPATFTRYDFAGGNLVSRESVNFTNREEQKYRVYNSGERNKDGEIVLRLNVWDWHPSWKFEVYEDGKKVENAKVKRVNFKDKLYDALRENTGNGIKSFKWLNTATTRHCVEYKPQNVNAEIRVVAFDEFGKEYFNVTTRVN